MADQIIAHIRKQADGDSASIAQLMRGTFGVEQTDRAVWHLRFGPPVDGLCFIAELAGRAVASLRFWEIIVAARRQLLLGPLAVDPSMQGKGVGKALVRASLSHAERLKSWDIVFLSGDNDYYPRFGFQLAPPKQFIWPGPLEQRRLHLRELRPGGLATLPVGPVALLPCQLPDR
jgi:predicted N-acetyltransferase YhbS